MKCKAALLVTGLGLGLSLGSCAALQTQEPSAASTPSAESPAPSATSLTSAALKNAEYRIPEYGTAKMTNGRYESASSAPEQRWTAGMLNFLVPGDLNGDGTEDAVALVWANGGGSGQFEYLAAVLNERGNPRNVATTLLGDRVRVNSITVDAGQIKVNLITQGPQDPMCCPTLAMTQTYELKGNKLELVSEQETGTVRQEVQSKPAPAAVDWLIIPGERVGQITAETTFQDLAEQFGADNLTNQPFLVGEGEQQPATRVDLGAERSFTIIWTDDSRTKAAAASQFGTAWKTPEGIGMGTSLADLREKLGPFQLYGFGWDYSGTVLLKGTLLARYQGELVLRLAPDPAISQKRAEDYQAVLGEGPFDSTNPHLQVLSPSVQAIIVNLSK